MRSQRKFLGMASAPSAAILALAAAGFLLLAVGSARAQVMTNLYGAATHNENPIGEIGQTGGVSLGVAWPHNPYGRWIGVWDIIGGFYDREQLRNGYGLNSVMWGMFSLRPGTTHSHSPVLIGEAGAGKRWGHGGLSTFTSLAAGIGYANGDHIPYVEYRRRFAIDSTLRRDNEIVVGIRFILFD
jgi:hypothetical protein